MILGLGACLSLGVIAAQGQEQHPTVVLDTSKGPITLELYPDKAPITVENFLKYVDDGFYDNLIFHRVIPKFMIQGGGMTDQMQEKEKGKRPPIKNESDNGLSNKRGTIAMARLNNPNSATLPVLHQPQRQSRSRLSEPRGLCRLRQGHRGHGCG